VVQNTYQERQKMTTEEFGLNVTYGKGSFSAGSKATKMMDKIIAKGRTVSSVSGHLSTYTVEIMPYWQLKFGASVTHFSNQFLPNNYIQNPAKYQEFFSTLGMHYFSTARFGGVMYMEIDTSKEYSE
jgi:hypothetical protein